ncbi:MAG: prephenate dehydratase [Candidatus Zixiibacteriota bacterium]
MSPKKVAFQGERGSFSEVAAKELVGNDIIPIHCETFEAVFELVESRRAILGVIPIENSLIGSIHKNYDLLLEHDLKVVGETQARVQHSLIALPNASLSRIKQVYSHPAALDQCRDFFKKHPKLDPVTYYDTAGAVKMLAEKKLDNAAAIARPHAAEIYKMKIMKKSIEDEKSNYTRFLLLGRTQPGFQGRAKTSIVFSMKNQPGVLFKALSVFALRDIDLTRIESRPVRKKTWQYNFYIDFAGSIKEQHVKNALDHLSEITHFIRILGSYPMRVVRD